MYYDYNVLKKGVGSMTIKQCNFVSFTDDEVRLLVCIAMSQRGLTDEELNFMRRLEKE